MNRGDAGMGMPVSTYQGAPKGLTGTTTSTGPVLTSNDTIQAGDVVCIGSDGLAYVAGDPATVAGVLKPLANAASAAVLSVAAPVAAQAIGGTNAYFAACVLSNGNIVTATTTAAQYVQITITTPAGVQVLQYTIAAQQHATYQGITLATLANGAGFVVLFVNAASSYPTVYTYNNAGTQTFTYSVGVAVGYKPVYVAAHGSGAFAVAFVNTSGYTYNAFFGVSGATFAYLSAGQCPSAGGPNGLVAISAGYCYAYNDLTNSYPYYATYNTAGGTLNSGQLAAATSYSGVTACAGRIVANPVTGGATIAGLTSSGGPVVAAIGSTGALVATTAALTGGPSGNSYPVGICHTSTGVAVVFGADSGGLYWAQVSTSGTIITNFAALGVPAGGNLYGSPSTFNGQNFAAYCLSDGSYLVISSYFGNYVRLPAAPSLAGVSVVNFSSFSGGSNLPTQAPTSTAAFSGLQAFAIPTGAGGATGRVSLVFSPSGFCSPVGVAQNAATAGNPVTLTSIGTATTRVTFKLPIVLDATKNAIPGQRMNIIGNQATLYGIQPTLTLRTIA